MTTVELKFKVNNKINSKTLQKLNNILLNNLWVKEEVSREIRKHVQLKENKNIAYKIM